MDLPLGLQRLHLHCSRFEAGVQHSTVSFCAVDCSVFDFFLVVAVAVVAVVVVVATIVVAVIDDVTSTVAPAVENITL